MGRASEHLPKPFHHRDKVNGTFCSIEREVPRYVVLVDKMEGTGPAERELWGYELLCELVRTTEARAVNMGKKLECNVPTAALRKYLSNMEPYERAQQQREQHVRFPHPSKGERFFLARDRWKD